MILDFSSYGTLDPRLNESTLILIPKKDGPVSLKDYRPISLFNVAYKFISKILVHRLRTILSRIISNSQGSFVQWRRALDQIVVAKEVIHGISRLKGSRALMAIKLDIQKAYDTLSWSF